MNFVLYFYSELSINEKIGEFLYFIFIFLLFLIKKTYLRLKVVRNSREIYVQSFKQKKNPPGILTIRSARNGSWEGRHANKYHSSPRLRLYIDYIHIVAAADCSFPSTINNRIGQIVGVSGKTAGEDEKRQNCFRLLSSHTTTDIFSTRPLVTFPERVWGRTTEILKAVLRTVRKQPVKLITICYCQRRHRRCWFFAIAKLSPNTRHAIVQTCTVEEFRWIEPRRDFG